jgi:hypothetical protein
MNTKIILLIDAVINFVLGVFLLAFPIFAAALGVPPSSTLFYPNILGAVLIGVAVALFIEAIRKANGKYVGLGLIGAISINLCGGIVLTLWLIFGRLALPVRGRIFLWSLAFVLVVLSGAELIFSLRENRRNSRRAD